MVVEIVDELLIQGTSPNWALVERCASSYEALAAERLWLGDMRCSSLILTRVANPMQSRRRRTRSEAGESAPLLGVPPNSNAELRLAAR